MSLAEPVLEAPSDPLAAVTHPDPYPYYARLVAERPLHFDERLRAWVAASAEAVSAALAHPALRVRPPAEPVPAALAGSPAAEIFGRLVRMNDGALHARLRPVVAQALEGLTAERVAQAAEGAADRLLAQLSPQRDRTALTRFCFAVPVETMASLLGIDAPFAELPPLVDRYVLAASGLADAGEVAAGKAAAATLLGLAGETLDRRLADGAPSLLAELARAGLDRPLALANGVGFLSQAYEATAALTAGTLLALGRHPDALAKVARSPGRLADAIQETLRWDPSTQVMRRFVGEDASVGGAPMRAGEAVLVLAAAASRDPALNLYPQRFELDRRERRHFGFGAHAHACPAEAIAPVIAESAIRRLLDAGLDPTSLAPHRRFRRSSFRVPVFRGA